MKSAVKPTASLLFVVGVLLFNTASAAPALVWSQYDSPGINVYFSPDGERKTQLTSTGKNVLPMLDRGNNEIWVCWVDKSAAKDNRLYYARLTAEGETLQSGLVPDTSGGIYAPSIAIESSGNRVWVAWSENRGRTEDLFVSYLNIGTPSADWAPAIQITANDMFSANMPYINLAESGEAQISWVHTGLDLVQSAKATVSVDLFDSEPASARQIKLVVTEYATASAGHSRVKYITWSGNKSADELSWKRLTFNETALMGAILSDDGSVTRVLDRRKIR